MRRPAPTAPTATGAVLIGSLVACGARVDATGGTSSNSAETAGPAAAADPSPMLDAAALRGVRIVSATAGPNGPLFEIQLEVETDVAAGPLVGSTSCSSIFDGTSLVLADPAGTEVLRQPHNLHCSPYDRGHPVELADGVTRTTLRFTIEPTVAWAGTTARLEGTLAGRADAPVRTGDVEVIGR